MELSKLSPETRSAKLSYPDCRRPVRMVLDTDTYNEVDDQFALAYALASPDRLQVEAVYAAPFRNERAANAREGMLKSYNEILRLFRLANRSPEGIVFRGSDRFLDGSLRPADSEAARDLIARARNATDDDPLYVVSIGAATNVASAMLLEPELIRRIVVVWLGGNPMHWPHAKEFNLLQDPAAAALLFDSGVPLVQIPCLGVSSHLTATPYELQASLRGKNAMCDTLVDLFAAFQTDWFGKAKELWDVAAIAYLLEEDWVPTVTVESPKLTEQLTWRSESGRHSIRSALFVRRNAIFRDMYQKLISFYSDSNQL